MRQDAQGLDISTTCNTARDAYGHYRLGGSHAQQDVLEQLFLDSALRAGARDDVRMVLERVIGRRTLPPAHWAGWRDAAGVVDL